MSLSLDIHWQNDPVHGKRSNLMDALDLGMDYALLREV